MSDNKESSGEISQFMRNNYIFQDEYRYWRGQTQANTLPGGKEYDPAFPQGKKVSHQVAWNNAADYWRKYTRYESTRNWQSKIEAAQDEDYDPVFEGIQFNQVVEKVMGELTPRQFQLFCLIIVQQDLDQYLNPELLQKVLGVTGKARPIQVKEIAKAMKLKLSPKNVCTPITNMRLHLRDAFNKLGLAP